jgi:hypothetical protein
MKTYKWQLRKGSKKEICPNCGQKRFVPYVLASDCVTPAGAEYGRCDREQSCGYQRYPDGDRMVVAVPQQVQPKEMLRYTGELKDTPPIQFHLWMSEVLTFTDALVAINDYHIDGIDDKVIWWQIDRDGVVRTGKVMKYLADGHRDKSDTFPVTWAHKHRRLKDKFQGEELQQCLFGEHLLTKYPEKPVALVESEKTAVILSRIYPDHLWLATGGSQGIKSDERLTPLRGRKVLLIPDNGQYWNWKRIADKYEWLITDALEKDAPFEGADILDIIELLNTLNNESEIF